MLFKVTGTRAPFNHDAKPGVDAYFNCPSEDKLTAYLLAQKMSEGGFSSFSITPVDTLPPETTITCPNCQHVITDEKQVQSVGMGIKA